MTDKIAKPFLKWAGGKTQLITEIEKSLPIEITNKKFTYIEPFVGSGAILFWMLENFPKLEKAVINDINEDLINTYRIIASKPKELYLTFQNLKNQIKSILGVPLSGRAFRYNLLFVPHKRISTAIPNAKLAA
jgi:DNA adenine methylase